tara:strand:+ start:896 stop:1015 length:120 start_codon:yes stop_codon:yes gene_type:complete
MKKGSEKTPLGETLPKKHHLNFNLRYAKLNKSKESRLKI